MDPIRRFSRLFRIRFAAGRREPLDIHEVGEIVGVVTADLPAPAWLSAWSAEVTLPSTRQPAPSEW